MQAGSRKSKPELNDKVGLLTKDSTNVQRSKRLLQGSKLELMEIVRWNPEKRLIKLYNQHRECEISEENRTCDRVKRLESRGANQRIVCKLSKEFHDTVKTYESTEINFHGLAAQSYCARSP